MNKLMGQFISSLPISSEIRLTITTMCVSPDELKDESLDWHAPRSKEKFAELIGVKVSGLSTLARRHAWIQHSTIDKTWCVAETFSVVRWSEDDPYAWTSLEVIAAQLETPVKTLRVWVERGKKADWVIEQVKLEPNMITIPRSKSAPRTTLFRLQPP